MPFNIPRDSNKKIIKNATTVNTSPTLSQTSSLGTTGQTSFASLTLLTLNGTPVTASAIQLNSLGKAMPGTAVPSTPIIMDNDKNISGINSISCNSLIINGINITASMFSSGVSTDASNIYLTDIIPGTAKTSKALIFDSNNNISNINNVSSTSLIVNGVNIIDNNSKSINLNTLNESGILTNFNLTAQYVASAGPSSSNSYIPNTYWNSICWSPELLLYVAVCNGAISGTTLTNKRVMTSKDGINWSLQTASSNSNFNSVCWSSKLKLFVAVGGDIMTSPDGINWTSRSVAIYNVWNAVCWSPELGMFVAIAQNIITSTDGINWTIRAIPKNYGLVDICWSPELNLFVCIASSSPSNTDKILVSTNGISWIGINNGLNNYSWRNICWSGELGIFIAITPGNPSYIMSSDGFKWVLYGDILSSTSPTCICWSKDLGLFIAMDSNGNNCNILYSPNGHMWYKNNTNSMNQNNQYNCIIWNSEYKQFIAVSATSQYDNSTSRVILSNPISPSILSPVGNSIVFSNTNNYVGINTNSPNRPLEINSATGNCFKHYNFLDNTKYVTYDILSTGQFNITTQKYFSITSDSSSYGLMLNNALIKTSASEFNTYLTNTTPGSTTASKLLMTDSNNNISGISLLSCNAINVNGIALTTSNNHQYFINATAGTAASSSAIVTDSNSNISNINQLSINNLIINNSKITNSSSLDIDLSNLKDNIQYSQSSIESALGNLTLSIASQTIAYYCSAYSPELGIFIAGGVATGNYKLSYSTNGITWTDVPNLFLNGQYIFSICWSPELMMFVASTYNYICISLDGKNWQVTDNVPEKNQFYSICWSPELNLFAAVANNSNATFRVSISHNGYDWFKQKVPNNYAWQSICWCNTIGLFIACSTDNQYTNLMSSPDGVNWTSITTNYTNSLYSVDWSEELNMVIAISGGNIPFLYSYDGITWTAQNIIAGYSWKNIKWIPEISIFLAVANGSMSMAYSYDGLNWKVIINSTALYLMNSSMMWSPELSMVIISGYSSSTNNYIITTGIFKNSSRSCLKSQSNEFVFDNVNGRIGLGITPTYNLHLSSDSAAKPSTSTWTVSSDERLKENIQDADLNLCYNNIKNLRLTKYTWKDDVYTSDEVTDRSKLGWIAQEVETIFPKAVEKHNLHGYEDCRTLNTDQIIASMYGCTKKIIENFTDDEEKFNTLSNKLQTLETFLNSLPEE